MNYLIVDDKIENLEGAKAFFQDRAMYVRGTLEGVEKIASSSFDLVISDLEMEHKRSGLDIAYAAGQKAIRTYIATGGFGHGREYVSILPKTRDASGKNSEVYGTKSDPEVWRQIEQFTKQEHIPFMLIEEGWKSSGRYPWSILEWAYFCDLGEYQPSEEFKQIVQNRLANSNK